MDGLGYGGHKVKSIPTRIQPKKRALERIEQNETVIGIDGSPKGISGSKKRRL